MKDIRLMQNHNPKTITFQGKHLLEMKSTFDKTSPLAQNLKKKAEELLSARTLNVVARGLKSELGDEHDYMSMGPYWWPNPETSDGLPYIRRDGEVNTETVTKDTYGEMTERVLTLSLAAFLFENEEYGRKAEECLRVWHLNEETYMRPHLEYGQAIPGICTGRGIGLIDTSGSYRLFDAIAMLEYMGYIDTETLDGIKNWYNEFLQWMLSSEKGLEEYEEKNNHGSWYDVQVAAISLFLGNMWLATRTLEIAYEKRVKAHIAEDGSQPLELSRTKGMSYSFYNLKALLRLASMAEQVDTECNYWADTEMGSSLLRKAIDFLYPYTLDLSSFPYQEISGTVPKSNVAEALMYAEAKYPGNGYAKKAEQFLDDTMLWQLYPRI